LFNENLCAIRPVESRDSFVVFVEFLLFVFDLNFIFIQNVWIIHVIFLDEVEDFAEMTVHEGELFIIF
jgi:hypothetical protein